jgi:hypothetical protein
MSFADLEQLRQGVRLEPLPQTMCDLLDKQPALIARVRRDLVLGLNGQTRAAAASLRRRFCAHWF